MGDAAKNLPRDEGLIERLIEENRLLRETIEHTPYPYGVFDGNDRLVAYSNAYALTHPELKAALSETKDGDRASYGWLMRRVLYGQVPDDQLDASVAKRVEDLHKSDGTPRDMYYPELGWLRIMKYRMPSGAIAGIAVDITELKERESELRQARELAEESERLRSEFLANMSHEIRTPMNGVLGMADLLRRTGLDEQQQMFVDTIVKSGKDLVRIIDDVLDLARIEAVGLDLDPRPFDPTEAVEDVATLLAGKAAEKGLELAVRFAGPLPKQVIGDAARFRQILTNLIGNAIKFTDKGHVLVRVLPHPTDCTRSGGTVELKVEVEDTGIGIASDRRDSIFAKFAQVRPGDRERRGGTGLGLSITKAIVDQMGGEVGFESEGEGGSTFWFRIELPIQDGVRHSANDPSPHSAAARVLIVGDIAINQAILAEQMIAWNCEPIALNSATHALQYLKESRDCGADIDLVIIDDDLPEMPGEELLRQVRIQMGNNGLPVILLSSVDRPDSTERLSHLGLFAVLTKPPRTRRLRDVVLSAVEARRAWKREQVREEPGDGDGDVLLAKVNNRVARFKINQDRPRDRASGGDGALQVPAIVKACRGPAA